ncbi:MULTISPECIES: hypothetical protein [Lactococcus]|uniref:hypothetical protein n=1 Tax=Lactococcus TaxID=1357 RepID=UPI00071E289B|nr:MULTISPECIES: hypothetical protein [Lactococcus]KAF6610673.1 hypothetical protein HFD74_04780 [Lactococcus sp. EKM201L]KAF6613382.1 hypothetical protein HFD15_05340 [Lactococcus sp. EKM203L]KAF6643974.1 hypothetical protein HFC73_00375 [Lactococcus sp. EKM501L]KAF6647958.1 hypothetical protein HFC72_02165 [Lactococcus sp. EKM502L]KAF6653510.1 hypothetical protein HFC74_04775 [Lactococcus sp. EKM101L]
MGFGFNFKDVNDRRIMKEPIIKDVEENLREKDFLDTKVKKSRSRFRFLKRERTFSDKNK